MAKSKILIYLCICFIIGIALDSLIIIPQSIWLGILILGTGLIIFSFKKKTLIILGFCLIILTGGILRHQVSSGKDATEKLIQHYDQEISLTGVIIKESEQRINQQKFQIKTDKIQGKILITTGLYPEYYYGDQLKISGKLRQPAQFEDFDYRAYLAKDKIHSVIYYPAITLLAQNQASWFYQRVFNFKDKLRKVIEQTLLPPQGAILKAVFLGDKYGLSDELKEKLNISGTRHIVAISGMHMIIMTQILLFLALAIGLWRNQAFYFVLIFLIIYIMMIGAPASAVRAGIMAGLLLLAQRVGRLRSADRAVVFAATVMLIINPLLLKSDVGFQLSFIAVLSIIYFKPFLDQWTNKWPNPFRFKDILTMTLAAQLGTLPLLIFHFGRLSLISPLANLLIVPFLPVIMISGLVLSFTGLIWLSLAKFIAWPVWLLLTYLLKIVEYLSSLPLAAVEFKNISIVILIGYYIILIGFIYYKEKQKYDFQKSQN